MTDVMHNNVDLWDQWQNFCCSKTGAGTGKKGAVWLSSSNLFHHKKTSAPLALVMLMPFRHKCPLKQMGSSD